MIDGFNRETQPLTDYEQGTLLPVIVQGLSTKLGKNRAITNKKICEAMTKAGYELDAARLRKIINYIRVNGLVTCLIATSKGYYITSDKEEMTQYLDSLVEREEAIAQVRRSLQFQMTQM